jgi:5-methylcytosine-specific restriction endonuclease McrA
MKTLILNADYTILQVCGIEKAISLLYVKEKATQVDFYQDTKIRGGKFSCPFPAVIALKKYVKHDWRRKKKFSRATVYKRDNYKCMYCLVSKPTSELTLDHVIPKKNFKSGENPTYYENVVTACKPCNARKADKSCDDARMWPAHKPYTPMYYDIILGEIKNVPKEWMPYMPNRGYKHE